MKNSKFIVIVCIGVLSHFVSISSASPINIDTFNFGSLVVVAFGNTAESSGVVLADEIIGGQREVSINTMGSSGNGIASAAVGDGSLGLGTHTFTSTFSAWFAIEYICDPMVDLLDDDGAPNTGMLFDFVTADHDFDLQVDLYSQSPSAGPTVKASIFRNFSANENAHQVFLPFAEFVEDAGFDIQSIQMIEIQLIGRDNGDYTLDNISVGVPEPASMSLLVLGGLLMGRRRMAS